MKAKQYTVKTDKQHKHTNDKNVKTPNEIPTGTDSNKISILCCV